LKKIKLIFITALIFLFGMQACTFEEPTLPTWFNEFTIPIPSPGFTVKEAINDSTIVDTTDVGEDIIAISISDSLDPQNVDRSDLAIKPDNDRLAQTIGDIRLDSPPSEKSDSLYAADILGVPLQAGQTVNVPQTLYNAPPQYLTFQDFDTIDVKNGFMQIEFYNNSFLNIRSGMEIYIYDHDETTEIGIAVFNTPVGPYSRALSDPVDMESQSFSNDLRFEMRIPLESDSHLLSEPDVNSSVCFTATFSELTVTQARAIIPEQDFTTMDSVSLADEEDKLIKARIDQGGFELHIANHMPVGAYITVELLNFYTSENYDSSSIFRVERYALLANSQDDVHIQLDNLVVVDYPPLVEPAEIVDYLHYQVLVETIPSGDEYIEITEDDSIIVTFNVIDSIYVSEFYGIIAPVEIDIEPQEQSDIIPVDDIEGSFLFDDLVMDLNVYNEIGIDVDVELNIIGYKKNRTESIRLEFDPNPFIVLAREEDNTAKKTTISLNSSNSNIVAFVEFLPEDILISGTALVEGEGSVTKDDQIWADYSIYSPFYMRIENNPRYASELEEVNLSENVRDAFAEGNVRDTRLNLDVINGLPVGAQLIIYASTDSTDIFSTVITDSSKKLIIDDISFSSGMDNNDDGFVDVPQTEYINIAITDEQVLLFSNETVYVASEILLENSDGVVKFRQSDEVTVEGTIKIRYRMNEE
jgi:hypothetical protein